VNLPHHSVFDAGVRKSSRLEWPRAIIIRYSPTAWAEWNKLEGTLTKFKAARGKETSDHKESDDAVVTSKVVEHERTSDASQEEFCRRSLTDGNTWDSFTELLENMKLREL